jgi:hypothetical protein
VNDEVILIGHSEDVGMGVVQGHMYLNEKYKLHLVRFWASRVTEEGARFLLSKNCLTSRGETSRLFAIHPKELELARQTNGKRKVHQTDT